MTVAIGYVRIGTDHIEKDPDRRIVEALTLVFAKFTEMQSVRQVHLWLRHERVSLPAVTYGAEGRRVEWKLPVYNTILHILTNPIYAGAYVFGRTGSRVSIEAGRKKVVRGFKKERKDWEVLIPNHHEDYELGRLREEPGPDRGQRQRQEPDEPRCAVPGRGPAWFAALWPLRA